MNDPDKIRAALRDLLEALDEVIRLLGELEPERRGDGSAAAGGGCEPASGPDGSWRALTQ